jgi:hypothetical protein
VRRAVFEALAVEGGQPTEVLIDSTHMKLHRSVAGGKAGRNSRLSASAGAAATPRSTPSPTAWPTAHPLLTPGQAADCRATERLLGTLLRRYNVHAHRAYYSNRVRDLIKDQGAVLNIPPKHNRVRGAASAKRSTRAAMPSRACCRPKDCRRLATLYDKLAANVPATSTLPP